MIDVGGNASLSKFKNVLQGLDVAVRRLTSPTLLAGNFNAKASLWGNAITDRRGDNLRK